MNLIKINKFKSKGNPEVFKIMVLREIKQLFMEPEMDSNPFYAGFGNKHNDALAYSVVGIPSNRIYTINPKGDIYQISSQNKVSYPKLNQNVDEIFPPVDGNSGVDDYRYNDVNYWKPQFNDSYELSVLEDLDKKKKDDKIENKHEVDPSE